MSRKRKSTLMPRPSAAFSAKEQFEILNVISNKTPEKMKEALELILRLSIKDVKDEEDVDVARLMNDVPAAAEKWLSRTKESGTFAKICEMKRPNDYEAALKQECKDWSRAEKHAKKELEAAQGMLKAYESGKKKWKLPDTDETSALPSADPDFVNAHHAIKDKLVDEVLDVEQQNVELRRQIDRFHTMRAGYEDMHAKLEKTIECPDAMDVLQEILDEV